MIGKCMIIVDNQEFWDNQNLLGYNLFYTFDIIDRFSQP